MSPTSSYSGAPNDKGHPKTNDEEQPPAVTFQSGADLLIKLKIVDSITHQGIRYIADHHPNWPFGPGRKYQYWTVANATVMATDPFLNFFRDNPEAGRGLGLRRSRRSSASDKQ